MDTGGISIVGSQSQCLLNPSHPRFALESEEDDMRKNFHSTSDILFKTQAIPGVRDLDKSKFTVGYHWDPVRHVSDLKLASIIFPKNLLKNANCLDYIQVSNSL